MKIKFIAVAVILVSLVISCAPEDSETAKKKSKVLVLCSGSMRAPFEKIKADYEKLTGEKIQSTYGGSGELCAQIQNSGRGDIYICHDPFMPWAADKGLITKWKPVGKLNVVIVVPEGNPKNIKKLEDLARPGLRIGIGDQVYSTSGNIAKHLLNALPYGDKIKKNIRVETKGHQQRCNDIILGNLDAGLVWGAVAQLYPDKLEALPIKELDELDAITSATYGKSDPKKVGVTVGRIKSDKKNPAADKFYEYILKDGQRVFTELNY